MVKIVARAIFYYRFCSQIYAVYMYIDVRPFSIVLDGIEDDLSRNVGHMGLRDMILWESSYWFSTLGQFFPGFYFLLGLEKRFDITLSNCYHNRSSLPPPKPTRSFPVGKTTKSRKEAKRDKTNTRVGTSVTVKVGEIDEKIREGESRRARKELVGLYYLSHIASALVLSHFWWLVPVFSMVYIWRTTIEVSSETPINV